MQWLTIKAAHRDGVRDRMKEKTRGGAAAGGRGHGVPREKDKKDKPVAQVRVQEDVRR